MSVTLYAIHLYALIASNGLHTFIGCIALGAGFMHLIGLVTEVQ